LSTKGRVLEKINIGIVGTGWCDGIWADVCADHPLVDELHIAETDEGRLAEGAQATNPASATTDYRRLIEN